MLTARLTTEDKVAVSASARRLSHQTFELDELPARIETLLSRNRRMISANPLTRLPGTPTIQKKSNGASSPANLGAAYIDIDNF